MIPVRTLAAIAALASALSAPAVVQAQEAVGVNAAIRNSVRTQPVGESALRPAALRGQVRTGDVFVSSAQSQLQILLRDQSIFTVGSNARVTLIASSSIPTGGRAGRQPRSRAARSASCPAVAAPGPAPCGRLWLPSACVARWLKRSLALTPFPCCKAIPACRPSTVHPTTPP